MKPFCGGIPKVLSSVNIQAGDFELLLNRPENNNGFATIN